MFHTAFLYRFQCLYSCIVYERIVKQSKVCFKRLKFLKKNMKAVLGWLNEDTRGRQNGQGEHPAKRHQLETLKILPFEGDDKVNPEKQRLCSWCVCSNRILKAFAGAQVQSHKKTTESYSGEHFLTTKYMLTLPLIRRTHLNIAKHIRPNHEYDKLSQF